MVVSATIHPDDEMFRVMRTQGMGERAYLQSGINNLTVFRKIIERHKPDAFFHPGSVLDHGCGYGRLTRHYRSLYGARRVLAADVTASLVEFCAREFDALPMLTGAEGKPMASYGEQADIIVSVSVFSHLPPDLFTFTMTDLANVLAPGRIAIITTAGEGRAARAGLTIGLDGFRYGPLGVEGNETGGRLSTEVYSTMLATEDYVRAEIEKAGLRCLEFIPVGHVGVQDIFVVTR